MFAKRSLPRCLGTNIKQITIEWKFKALPDNNRTVDRLLEGEGVGDILILVKCGRFIIIY